MSNSKMRALRKNVNAELARMAATNDGLRPSEVVAAATDESSPLHGQFEWDDGIAGHEYRLGQARQLIRVSVSVVAGLAERYIHVPADRGEGVYLPISVVVQSDLQFALALAELARHVRGAEQAVRELRDAASGDDDRLLRIDLAVMALANAGAAVAAVH